MEDKAKVNINQTVDLTGIKLVDDTPQISIPELGAEKEATSGTTGSVESLVMKAMMEHEAKLKIKHRQRYNSKFRAQRSKKKKLASKQRKINAKKKK